MVDASIAVDLLARYRPEPIEQALWAPGTHLAAPELLDIEALHALRRLDRDGRIPASRIEHLVMESDSSVSSRWPRSDCSRCSASIA